MFLSKTINLLPKRAMASKPPSKPDTTSSTIMKSSDETAVSKTDQTEGDAKIVSHGGDTTTNYNNDGVGFKADKYTKHIYLNPLLTPPPRSPKTPEDFRHPQRLGHWNSYGFDYTSPIRDRYRFHEYYFWSLTASIWVMWLWMYGPDFRGREWARREAFLRTAKREALGLPLIDKDVVDPDRIVLPTEEELGDFYVAQ